MNSRREFLKKAVLSGAGVAGAGIAGCAGQSGNPDPFARSHSQVFNMAGYAAPRLDVIRSQGGWMLNFQAEDQQR
jgi:hypothetical protein